MSCLDEIELTRDYPFRGRVFDIASCKVKLPDGKCADRDIMCHSGGVCVLPVDRDGRAILVRQYRFGAGAITLEVPAGKLEKGEIPDEAVRRELEEETGCHADRIEYLGFCYASPAISTEIIHIYLATGLTSGSPHTDPDEFLETLRLPLDELVERVMKGDLPDAKTQIAVLKAARLLQDRGEPKQNG